MVGYANADFVKMASRMRVMEKHYLDAVSAEKIFVTFVLHVPESHAVYVQHVLRPSMLEQLRKEPQKMDKRKIQ